MPQRNSAERHMTDRPDPALTASEFVGQLMSLGVPGSPSRAETASPGNDRPVTVRMGDIFALAKRFIDLEPDQIEELLESSVHEVRVGAVSIMDFPATRFIASPGQKTSGSAGLRSSPPGTSSGTGNSTTRLPSPSCSSMTASTSSRLPLAAGCGRPASATPPDYAPSSTPTPPPCRAPPCASPSSTSTATNDATTATSKPPLLTSRHGTTRRSEPWR